MLKNTSTKTAELKWDGQIRALKPGATIDLDREFNVRGEAERILEARFCGKHTGVVVTDGKESAPKKPVVKPAEKSTQKKPTKKANVA